MVRDNEKINLLPVGVQRATSLLLGGAENATNPLPEGACWLRRFKLTWYEITINRRSLTHYLKGLKGGTNPFPDLAKDVETDNGVSVILCVKVVARLLCYV